MIQGFAVTWTANERQYRREFTIAQESDAVWFEHELADKQRRKQGVTSLTFEAMLEAPVEAPARPSRPPARAKPEW